jgi:hypothetical protein
MIERVKRLTLFAWLLIVSAAYLRYFPLSGILDGLPKVHAFAPALALALPLLLLLVILAAAAGLGGVFWGRFQLFGGERLLLAAGTGLGMLSLAVLLSDLFGFAGKVFFIAMLATGLAMLVIFRQDYGESFSKGKLLLLLAALPALLSALIGALAPPTQFDSLVYHLALPYRYFAAGGYTAVPWNIFSSFPQNIEMLYQLALTLNGDILANLIHWSFLPLTGLGVYLLARRTEGETTGAAAALIWLYTPAALFLATGTYIDLGLAFYVLLGIHAYIFWDETGEDAWLWASGVFMGLAAGAKYTAAFPALLIALFALFRSKGVIKPLKFAAVSLLVFLPWLFKNLVYLHNPIAPWGSAAAPGYFSHVRSHGMPVSTVMDVLYVPWNLTFFGFSYGGAFDLLGPVFLLFLPALFLWRKSDKIIRILVLFCTGFAVCWFFSGKVLRFLMPVIPLLSILAAKGLANLPESRVFRTAVYLFLAGAMAHNLLMFHWTMAPVDPYACVIAGEPRDSYLAGKLDYYKAARVVYAGLPPGSKTLFWGETRGYYCGAECAAPTVFDLNPAAAAADSAGKPADIAATLAKSGFTHIFVNFAELKRLNTELGLSASGARNWDVFRRKYLKPVYTDKECGIFKIAGAKI